MLCYSDFITEKMVSLVLESKMQFSEGICAVLRSVKSRISNEILTLNSKDIETSYNYIDLSKDENDSVTFIPDRRAQQIISNQEQLYKYIDGQYLSEESTRNSGIFQRLGYTASPGRLHPTIGAVGRIVAEEISSSTGRIYVHFECTESNNPDEIGKVGILRKSNLEPTNSEFKKLWTSYRNKIKVGRLVRALLQRGGIKFTESEIEQFVNGYKSTIDIMNDAFSRFDVVSGEKLYHFYKLDNYKSEDGTLGNSCMATVPDSYLYIYGENPETCQLVILYDEAGEITDGRYKSRKIGGRALLWTLDDGSKFMDRVYTTNDSDVDLFKKYADKMGWWSKYRQDSSYDFTAESGGKNLRNPKFVVSIKKWEDEFPYVDTLSFMNMSSGKLSNDPGSIEADAELRSTGGGYDDY